MKKKVLSSVISSILVLSFALSTTVNAETINNVPEPLTNEEITIGKDYKIPNLEGKWIYKEFEDSFSWSLNWEKITYAKAYKIYRKTEKEEYKLLATIDNKKELNYVDTSMEYGQIYTYKLNYIHGNREIELSEEVQVNYALDSDGDGLYDILEFKKGTDVLKSDSDGDGLSDGYEAIGTRTNYLKADTDNNGTLDGKEDLDNDGLDNLTEKELNTNPKNEDTDADKVWDGDEIKKGINPVKSDTDGDGLEDGFELSNNFNPLKQDTDDDGIFDSDEQVEVTTKIEEYVGIVQPSVVIKSKASEANSTYITNFKGEYSSLDENLPGLIGDPYEFDTDVDFDMAKMQFSYDKDLHADNFKPAIFYFNEETNMLEKLEGQSIDIENGTVTANVSHFSVYLLLNEVAWDEAWAKEMKTDIIGENGEAQYIDVVFSIDSSGSMSWNDPDELRKEAAKSFVDKLRELDQAAVVDFDDYARTLVSLTTDHAEVKYQIDTIDNWGGTNLYAGLNKAVSEVSKGNADHKRFIIFLTDGDGYWHESALDAAKANNVTVYTIGLGSSLNQALLQRIATETGGKYFHATNAEELKEIHDSVADETISSPDTDQDGLSDAIEEFGFRTELGIWIKTNPNLPDTDGDGLSDGAEVGSLINVPLMTPYYNIKSDPTKKDTDDDGLDDNVPGCNQIDFVTDCKDLSPKKYDVNGFIGTLMSDISYVNMESETSEGKKPKIQDLKGDIVTKLNTQLNHNLVDRNKEDWNAVKTYLNDWKLIKAEDSSGWDFGLGAVALQKGNKIIIAYRGSEGYGEEIDAGEIVKDWLGADITGIALVGNNLQVPGAKDFAYDVIIENPNAEVYVTGHSLGGFLAQVISYDIIEEKIDNSAFWIMDQWKMQNILNNNPNIFKRGLTYNAAPFLHNFNPAGLIFRAVPILDTVSNKYDDKIYNYSINTDPLSESVFSGIADRVGRDVPKLPYNGPDGNFESHQLKYFYNHFQ